MIVHLGTSTVLRALLHDGPVLDGWGTCKRAYSSELLGVEARRAFDRLRLTGTIDDDGVVAPGPAPPRQPSTCRPARGGAEPAPPVQIGS